MKIDRERFYQEYRLRLINPLLNCSAEQQRSLLKQISESHNVSIKTLKRYLHSYHQSGLTGLIPGYKGSGNNIRLYIDFDKALARAVELRKQDPFISVRNIIVVLESEHPEWKGIFRRSTIQSHLQKAHATKKDLVSEEKCHGRKSFGRYRKAYRLEQIQCDVKEFPRVCVNEKGIKCKAYLQLWSDNYSRKILAFKLSDTQDVTIALDPLHTLIERYGLFDSILTDNGSIYRSAQMAHTCRVLGINLKFCKPYAPEGKGMIERQNLAANAIEHQIEKLENVRLSALSQVTQLWINDYNDTKSMALGGVSPNEAFESSPRPLKEIDPDMLNLAFKQSESRKVAKDGTISVNNVLYKVDLNGIDVHHRVNLLLGYDGSVEQIFPEDNHCVKLFPLEIKPDVEFKLNGTTGSEDVSLKSNADLLPQQKQTTSDAAYLFALMREATKKRGLYKDEESFLKYVKERFFLTPSEIQQVATQVASPNQLQLKSFDNANNCGTATIPSALDSPFSKLESRKEEQRNKKEDMGHEGIDDLEGGTK